MKPSSVSLRLYPGIFVVMVACLLATPYTRAEDAPAGVMAFTIEVPGDKLSLKEVHDIVMRASIGRTWGVKEDSDNRIVIYLNHRKNEATVTYLLTEKLVRAYCEGYATNGKGARKGPEQPTSWLNYLKKDINKGLNEAVYLDKK